MVCMSNYQQLHIKRVSPRLMYQIRLEAEATGVTMRAWVLGYAARGVRAASGRRRGATPGTATEP